MEATPEQSVEATRGKEGLAARYKGQAGHILVATKFRTDSGRLLAIFSADAAVGSMWVPIQGDTMSLEEAKALCVWFNSTLGALGFLMRRGTMLTNPSFSQAELATLPVPDFKRTDVKHLADAYELTKLTPVRPWLEAANDGMRELLDQAASQTTGINLDTIRDWRRRISREPTVSGRKTPDTPTD